MIPLYFLETLAAERSMSESELEVLSQVIDGKTIAEISQKLDTTPEAVRKRLGEVYKRFHIAGSGPGKLAKLQQILVSLYQKRQTQDRSSSSSPDKHEASVLSFELHKQTSLANLEPRQDWGEAPDVNGSVFYGRDEALAMLRKWIVEEYRLIALLGIGGVGKTTLSVKLVEQILTASTLRKQDQFKYFIWRSLQLAPSLRDLLADLIQFLSSLPKTDLPDTVDSRLSLLFDYLQKHRCLLVLDNAESVLEKRRELEKRCESTEQDLERYQDYDKLLERVAEERHQSCLLLISREKPGKITLLEAKDLPVRTFLLPGLQEKAAREILKAKGLSDEENWEDLIQIYQGNPSALKIVAATIQRFFGGKVSEFLKQETIKQRFIDDILEQQFNSLSNLEKEIMYQLAINYQPISFSGLREHILIPGSELLEVLEALLGRSLIKGEAFFRLEDVIEKYVTNRLAEQVCDEIHDVSKTQKIEKLNLLSRYALSHTAPQADRIKVPNVLTQVKHKLLKRFRAEASLEPKTQLTKILDLLSAKPSSEVSSAKDNINKLLEELKALDTYDASYQV